jgi:sensor histidine kinase YesM
VTAAQVLTAKPQRGAGGLGLVSMEERLRLHKGMLSIESQPKQGTTIHARVPLSSGGGSFGLKLRVIGRRFLPHSA